MTNPGKSPRGKGADAAVRGAIDTSHRAAGALLEEMIPTRAYQLYRERHGRVGAQPTLGAVGDRRAQ